MATESYQRLTASGVVMPTKGRLAGFYVSSTSSGTLTLYDNTTASGPQVTGTITPAVGWNALPVDLQNGLFAAIGGTLDVTFVGG
jgi:hypothetical protein